MHVVARMLLGLFIASALVACGGSADEAAPTQSVPLTTVPADANRQRAPALEGETLAGAALALGDFRGEPVLINVWSSW